MFLDRASVVERPAVPSIPITIAKVKTRSSLCHPEWLTCLSASQGWNDSAPATRALGGPFKPFFGLSGLQTLPARFVPGAGLPADHDAGAYQIAARTLSVARRFPCTLPKIWMRGIHPSGRAPRRLSRPRQPADRRQSTVPLRDSNAVPGEGLARNTCRLVRL
jgi:hypothetical protein